MNNLDCYSIKNIVILQILEYSLGIGTNISKYWKNNSLGSRLKTTIHHYKQNNNSTLFFI